MFLQDSPCRSQHPEPRALAVLLLALSALCGLAACDSAVPAIDLIVAGDTVIVMDDDNTLIRDGAVAVDDGFIVAVGPYDEIAQNYRAKEMLDGVGKVVLPGLINTHTHAAMSLLRGIADDKELMDWLLNYIFPVEVRFVDEEFVRIGTELACWEMIRGGTTTFVDMYYFNDSVAEAVENCGLRAVIATSVIDQPSPDAANAQEGLAKAIDFIERWQGRNNRIIPVMGVHSVYTVKPPELRAVREAADRLGVLAAIHLAESPSEMQLTMETYGTTPIGLLESLGFFNGPTLGAHVIYPREDEIPLLASRGVGVTHDPSSNMKISAGVSPVAAMLDAGVKVGLGTDGPATNNDLDMWEEMRIAAFLQKVSTMDPEVLPAAAALRMATRGGAEALGLEDQIGSLLAGHRADLIQVSLADVHFVPAYNDIVSQLVYVGDEQDVTSVVVDGKVIMRDKTILTIDAERVRREANEVAARIRAALAESSD
jgi:5-methylthioadenosine/S-adenosylhomocysteine deaminase